VLTLSSRAEAADPKYTMLPSVSTCLIMLARSPLDKNASNSELLTPAGMYAIHSGSVPDGQRAFNVAGAFSKFQILIVSTQIEI